MRVPFIDWRKPWILHEIAGITEGELLYIYIYIYVYMYIYTPKKLYTKLTYFNYYNLRITKI